jgi:hypothetical protein
MTQRPVLSLFRKPTTPAPPAAERNIASFDSLADALRALADIGSRWRWAAVHPAPGVSK